MGTGRQIRDRHECTEERRLFVKLSNAWADLFEMQSLQLAALWLHDRKIGRFDEESTAAVSAWTRARKNYMEHLRKHGC